MTVSNAHTLPINPESGCTSMDSGIGIGNVGDASVRDDQVHPSTSQPLPSRKPASLQSRRSNTSHPSSSRTSMSRDNLPERRGNLDDGNDDPFPWIAQDAAIQAGKLQLPPEPISISYMTTSKTSHSAFSQAASWQGVNSIVKSRTPASIQPTGQAMSRIPLPDHTMRRTGDKTSSHHATTGTFLINPASSTGFSDRKQPAETIGDVVPSTVSRLLAPRFRTSQPHPSAGNDTLIEGKGIMKQAGTSPRVIISTDNSDNFRDGCERHPSLRYTGNSVGSDYAAHPSEEARPDVPYCCTYSPENRLLDIINVMYAREAVGILPWVGPAESLNWVPKRVLDIGCGVDAFWIREAAEVWPETRFVGMDIAPIDANQTPPFASFVQGDFLQFPWPFESHSFDFVRIAFVGHGVYEKSWNDIFSEAARVLVRGDGGRIQCIDVNAYDLLEPQRRNDDTALNSTELQEVLHKKAESKQLRRTLKRVLEHNGVCVEPATIFPLSFMLNFDKMSNSSRPVGPLTESQPPPSDLTSDVMHRGEDNERGTDTNVPYKIPAPTVISAHEINERVLRQARVDALPRFSLDTIMAANAAGTSSNSQKDQTNQKQAYTTRKFDTFEKSIQRVKLDATLQIGLAQVIAQELDWICEFDVTVEKHLTKQIGALTNARAALPSASLESVYTDDDERASRALEIDRALRDSKKELAQVRSRLGITSTTSDTTLEPDASISANFIVKTGWRS